MPESKKGNVHILLPLNFRLVDFGLFVWRTLLPCKVNPISRCWTHSVAGWGKKASPANKGVWGRDLCLYVAVLSSNLSVSFIPSARSIRTVTESLCFGIHCSTTAMSAPVFADIVSYFYPIGNTPAVHLTRNLPPKQPADILLLGCGDVRNILFTIYADHDFSLWSTFRYTFILTDVYFQTGIWT